MLRRVSWITPSGDDEVVLYEVGAGVSNDVLPILERGRLGLEAPPAAVESTALLGAPGEYRVGAKVQAREVTLPLFVSAASPNRLEAEWQRIIGAMDPLAGAGRLRFLSDEADRVLHASYLGGLEGSDDKGSDGIVWRRAILKLRAHDPYWRDTDSRQLLFQQNQQKVFFPMSLGQGDFKLNADATFGVYVAPDVGDAPAYPEWWISGPFDSFTVSNSAGEMFQYGAPLLAGETLYLRMNPLDPYIGTSGVAPIPSSDALWGSVVWPSTLWSIRKGAESVSVTLVGASTASTATLRWQRRWRSWRGVA